MRQILIDYARQRRAAKRGGGVIPAEWDDQVAIPVDDFGMVLEIDSLLGTLAEISERQAKIVEMRFFVGLTEEEIAEVLQVTTRTVQRDWYMARAWMRKQMEGK